MRHGVCSGPAVRGLTLAIFAGRNDADAHNAYEQMLSRESNRRFVIDLNYGAFNCGSTVLSVSFRHWKAVGRSDGMV
jgi:hypothetical protein